MLGLEGLAVLGVGLGYLHRGVNMGRFLPAAIAGALVAAFGAAGADAAVSNVQFNGSPENHEIVTPVAVGDGIGVHGFITTQSTSYENKVTFTAGAGVTSIDSAAGWFGTAPLNTGVFGNTLTYTLLDSLGTVLATDVGPVFTGAPGTVSGSLSFAGLTPGNKYTLDIFGTPRGTVNYDLKAVFTPIPSAVLLLGSALAGVGYLGYRRRA